MSQQWGLSASGPGGGLCSAGIHSQMHIQTPICQQSLGSESLESHMLPQLSLPHLPSAPLNGPGSQGGLSARNQSPILPLRLCGGAEGPHSCFRVTDVCLFYARCRQCQEAKSQPPLDLLRGPACCQVHDHLGLMGRALISESCPLPSVKAILMQCFSAFTW